MNHVNEASQLNLVTDKMSEEFKMKEKVKPKSFNLLLIYIDSNYENTILYINSSLKLRDIFSSSKG